MTSWVFLRGWAREARHWGEFPALFKSAMPDASIRALDLPGNGSLRASKSPLSVAAMVGELRALLRTEGASGPYHLLGLSLGAMASAEWAAAHPDEIRSCVLINASLRPFSSFHERLRPRSYATLLRLALLEGDAQAREAAILRLTSTRPHAGLPAIWARYGSERPVARANVLRQLIAAARYRASAKAPAVPLLILASAGDRLVDPKCSAALARHWQAPIATHPTAGHDLTLDDPAWVAAQVKSWLRPTSRAA
jgi:pimeloyl-ACP methyl ester carboxylesterase